MPASTNDADDMQAHRPSRRLQPKELHARGAEVAASAASAGNQIAALLYEYVAAMAGRRNG